MQRLPPNYQSAKHRRTARPRPPGELLAQHYRKPRIYTDPVHTYLRVPIDRDPQRTLLALGLREDTTLGNRGR